MHIILKTNIQRPMKSFDYDSRFTRNYSRCKPSSSSTNHFNGIDGTTEGRGVNAVEVSSWRDEFVVVILTLPQISFDCRL